MRHTASSKNDSIRDRAIVKIIHQVNSDEFDCVVLFVPKPHSENARAYLRSGARFILRIKLNSIRCRITGQENFDYVHASKYV